MDPRLRTGEARVAVAVRYQHRQPGTDPGDAAAAQKHVQLPAIPESSAIHMLRRPWHLPRLQCFCSPLASPAGAYAATPFSTYHAARSSLRQPIEPAEMLMENELVRTPPQPLVTYERLGPTALAPGLY
jgi:hypothetical protein